MIVRCFSFCHQGRDNILFQKIFKQKYKIIFILTIFIFIGCAHLEVVEYVKSKGLVLKEYKDELDEYIIVKEGNRIKKYRIYDWSTFLDYGTKWEYVYIIDTTTQTCYTGSNGQTPIECLKVKRDTDLSQYITWENNYLK